MKRMIEWGGMVSVVASVGCGAYWFASIITDAAGFYLVFGRGPQQLQIAAENGMVNFTNNQFDGTMSSWGPK